MWIIKIGGSWIKSNHLDELISKLANFKREKILIVTGGGCIADSIREIFKINKMEESAANFLALKATEIFGHMISQKNPSFKVSENTSIVSNQLVIWSPSKKLQSESTFERNWNSTSDSVAMWLGNKIDSRGIIFLKSISFEFKKECTLKKLQNKNILDKNIHKYLKKKNYS